MILYDLYCPVFTQNTHFKQYGYILHPAYHWVTLLVTKFDYFFLQGVISQENFPAFDANKALRKTRVISLILLSVFLIVLSTFKFLHYFLQGLQCPISQVQKTKRGEVGQVGCCSTIPNCTKQNNKFCVLKITQETSLNILGNLGQSEKTQGTRINIVVCS